MAEPINPNLPENVDRLARKYGGTAPDPNNVLYPAFSAASPAATTALRNLDLQRVARGQSPYTATESALGLTAATRGRAVTPDPEPTSLFGGFIDDLSTLIRGIPQLPAAILNEGRLIPDALENADLSGSSPLATLGNVANLPGVRFIPGSFIAGAFGDPYTDPTSGQQVTPEGVDQLTAHPLFTALDVLPFATRGAKMTGAYRDAAAAYTEQARILGTAPPRAPRPIPTMLRQLGGGVEQVPDLRAALIDAGQMPERGFGAAGLTQGTPNIPGPIVRPGPVGRALDNSATRFAGTAPGRYLSELRSPLSRTTAERGVYNTSTIIDETRAPLLDPVAARIQSEAFPELQQLSASITPERMTALYDDMTSGRASDPTHAATYTPEESAYLARVRQAQDDIAAHLTQIGADTYALGRRAPRSKGGRKNVRGLLEVQFPHGTELYDYATGAAILDRRYDVAQKRWMVDKLEQFNTHTDLPDISLVRDEIVGILDDNRIDAKTRTQAVRLSLAHAFRSGWDVERFMDMWDHTRNERDRARFRAAVDDPRFVQVPKYNRPDSPTTIADAATTLAAHRTDPHATLLRDHLTAGRWSEALSEIRTLKTRQRFAIPVDLDNLRLAVRDQQQASRIAARSEKLGFTAKAADKAAKAAAKAEIDAMPARWDDLARADFRRRLTDELADMQANGQLTAEQAARGIDAASKHMIAQVEMVLGEVDPALLSVIGDLYKESTRTWQTMAQAGVEPRWVHRVTNEGAARMANPQILDNATLTAGQLKQRMWDPAPYVRDLTVSVAHQAYDILHSIASRNFAEEMANWYGVSGLELHRRFERRADEAYARDPSKSRQAHLNDLVRREFTAYDPKLFTRGKRPKGLEVQVSRSDRQVFIPRTVAATLDALRPPQYSTFSSAIGKPMQVFRTSLLPLSPRWHLYNIVGGAIMLGATFNPRDALAFVDAYRLARNEGRELGRIESPTGTAAMPPGGPLRESTEWFRRQRLNPRSQAALAHSVAGGATLGRIMRQVWESKASTAARDAGSRVIEGSYAFNQFVDNFYRSMSYLSGERSALRRGASQAEAVDAGIVAARDALQSWDRLTPIERSGMRVLLPFYSWTAHLFRFVMQYPHDHPWRLAITARIAETELADQNSGLPMRFQSMFTPFGIAANGDTTAILADGLNPFKDVTNWGMLAGFMLGQQEGNIAALTSGLNPFISVALESAGFDTFRGNPDLYPDLAYNPATGQLSALPNGNPLLNLATSFVPQSEVLVNMAGMNEDFNDLWRRDPDAARRMLWGSLGLPSGLVRDLNINEEIIKAEVQRYTQFSDTRAQALKTGNFGALAAYPVLDAYRTQIQKLQDSGQLDEYQPATNPATADQIANRGLVEFLLPG